MSARAHPLRNLRELFLSPGASEAAGVRDAHTGAAVCERVCCCGRGGGRRGGGSAQGRARRLCLRAARCGASACQSAPPPSAGEHRSLLPRSALAPTPEDYFSSGRPLFTLLFSPRKLCQWSSSKDRKSVKYVGYSFAQKDIFKKKYLYSDKRR